MTKLLMKSIKLLSNENNIKSHSTYFILELYTKIFKSNEKNLPILKLNINEMLISSKKIIEHYFSLFYFMNEDNIGNISEEINILNEFVKYSLVHLSYFNEEKSPYRNILLRNLVDKLFEISTQSLERDKIPEEELINDIEDSTSNLFYSNLNLHNNDISHKSKFKKFKNTLAEFAIRKSEITKKLNNSKYTIMMSFSYIQLLETICSRSLENTNEYLNFKDARLLTYNESFDANKLHNKYLLNDQMSYLAEIIVQIVMLDQHYIDNQWPTSNDDENIEMEVDAIKLYVERDVAVQKTVENINNNKIIWMILEFLAMDEQSFLKCTILIRSLLASLIIQWDSGQEQPARNMPKLFEITTKLLNLLNKVIIRNIMSESKYLFSLNQKVQDFLPKPLCFIVDIIPFLNSYEIHICLLLIWRYLKVR